MLRKNMNLVTCVKCKSSFDYRKGKSTEAPSEDAEGKKLN
jgi:nitrite reductase/ring-hydroxylating ferredoxin subunit